MFTALIGYRNRQVPDWKISEKVDIFSPSTKRNRLFNSFIKRKPLHTQRKEGIEEEKPSTTPPLMSISKMGYQNYQTELWDCTGNLEP